MTSYRGGEQLKVVSGGNLIHFPDPSATMTLNDAIAVRVSMLFSNLPTVQPFIEKGTLIAIGNTAPVRSPLLPRVPSAREQRFKELELSPWIGF